MSELLLLRMVHILAGTFWIGVALMNTFFLMPAIGSAGAAGGAVMQVLRARGILHWLLASSVLTLLSGVRLLWILSAGAPSLFFGSPMGRMFTLGGVAALLGFLLAMLVVRPSQMQAMALLARLGDAPEAEWPAMQDRIGRLRSRGALGSTVNAVLLVASAAGMAVARYL